MPFSTAVRTSRKGCTVALFQRICCALFMRLATIALTALHERRRDRLTTPAPGRVGHQRAPVALEVAQQVADVSLEAADAGHVTHGLAPRPAAQGSELAPTARPAAMPETPLRTVQGANRVVGEERVSRAEAAGRRQRVLEAHGRV